MTSPYNREQPEGNPYSSQFSGQDRPYYSQEFHSGGYPQQGYPQQGYPQQQYAAAGNQKSWVAALLLCFFLGSVGAHNFYTGCTTYGVVQLSLNILGWFTFWFLLGFLFWTVLGIWVFIEFFMILLGVGDYDKDARGVPLKK